MTMIYVNGAMFAEDDARISVLDHGLVVGDGVFETVLLSGGRPFALTRHLDRLERSALGLGLRAPDAGEVRDAIDRVLASSSALLGRIRITVTAGLGPLGSARLDGPQSLVVAVAPETLGHANDAAVVVVPWCRNERGALSGLKTTSYAENAVAVAYATARGAEEAIFANTVGDLCEGTGSNVFLVRGGELITPPLSSGCLAGITRALVCEAHPTTERAIPIAEFVPGAFEEAFITSSIRGVLPISTIDGVPVASGVGPVSEKIRLVYEELVSSTPDP